MRNLALVDRTGASFEPLAEPAQTSGYEALSVRASLSKLDSYYNPWIADWQEIHCVVVWRDKGDRILISELLPLFSATTTAFIISIL
ncbi:MAG: cysteine peptidase family C39 domain-containing protein [Nostoc sp.]